MWKIVHVTQSLGLYYLPFTNHLFCVADKVQSCVNLFECGFQSFLRAGSYLYSYYWSLLLILPLEVGVTCMLLLGGFRTSVYLLSPARLLKSLSSPYPLIIAFFLLLKPSAWGWANVLRAGVGRWLCTSGLTFFYSGISVCPQWNDLEFGYKFNFTALWDCMWLTSVSQLVVTDFSLPSEPPSPMPPVNCQMPQWENPSGILDPSQCIFLLSQILAF